jgi:hypothetical protein
MPFKKGEFFFEAKQFLRDESEYAQFKDEKSTYQSEVHIKYQSPKVRKARMVLYDSVLVVLKCEKKKDVSFRPFFLKCSFSSDQD